MASKSQSSDFQPCYFGSMGPQSYAPPFPMEPPPPGVGSVGPQSYAPPFPMQPPPPGVGSMGPQSYAPPFPMQPSPPGVGSMGPQSYAPPFPKQPPPPGVGSMGPQSYAPPFPMQPPPPGVGSMGLQSYAPPFPMQQGLATLGPQQFRSVGHDISSPNVGMPSSQGQPLQFSQPILQLPPRLGQPNIPQTQQTALHLNQHMSSLGGPGTPFSSSCTGTFSSSHIFASSSFGQQPNAANVSSRFPPLSQMHAYVASNVSPMQVTEQQPSVTTATVLRQSMQVSLIEAEDVIGIGGVNFIYIHSVSGADLTVSETVGIPDEMTVKIEGTLSQVERAQHLIQECIYRGTSAEHLIFDPASTNY